jgi:hypothetical protein
VAGKMAAKAKLLVGAIARKGSLVINIFAADNYVAICVIFLAKVHVLVFWRLASAIVTCVLLFRQRHILFVPTIVFDVLRVILRNSIFTIRFPPIPLTRDYII